MYIFRFILTACFCCLLTSVVAGQSLELEPDIFQDCVSSQLHEKLLRENPKYRAEDRALEAAWGKEAKAPTNRKSAPPYTLPIVFHIVHENGAENIGNDDILRSLDFTNQAFANTDYYDQGTGVNTQIQFCLAQRTPDNLPTNGINRIVSPLTELTATAEDVALKDLMRWSPREYINVWVVKEICGLGLGCGVAGYAYYPSAHGGSRDGIVVEARWLAGNEARVGVLIHELGHYLGLRHTFDGGCKNDDCTVDGDAVCDTPPDQSKAAVPCSGTANSCTTDTDSGFATDQNDMFINYMDYGRFNCYSAFTAGQRDRMHFFLEGRRRSLLTSLACSDPCPSVVDASFSGGDVTVNVGTTINFTNLSTNGDRFSWRQDGIEFATSRDASAPFNVVGTFTISLLVESNDGLCSADSMRQRVTVICPVTAGFTLPDSLVEGTQATFANTSVATTNQTWNVAGMDVSTDRDLSFTFDSAGLYQVCLSTTNGFCEQDFCRTIFVSRPRCTDCPIDSCEAAFLFAYGSPGEESSGEFTVALPYNDDFLAGGNRNGSPVIVRLDATGTPVWTTQLFPNAFFATVSRMIIDQTGMLAGFGRLETNNNQNLPFIFRIDPTDGTLLWGRTLAAAANGEVPSFKQIVHAGPSEPYRFFGKISSSATNSDALLVAVNSNDGSLLNGLGKRYDFSSSSEFVDALYDPTSGLFYVLANNSSIVSGNTPLLLGLDFIGDLQQAASLVEPGVSNDVFGVSLAKKGGILSALCTNREQISNTLISRVYNVAVNGTGSQGLNMISTYDYFAGQESIATKIAANDLGYLISLTSFNTGERILRQIDPAGAIIWSRIYPDLRPSATPAEVRFEMDDQHILLPGYLGAAALPALARLSPAGLFDSPCWNTRLLQDSLISVRASTVPFGNESISELPFQTNEFFYEPVELSLAAISCREDCPGEEEENCDAPFLLQADEADAVTFGGYTTVVRDGDDFYVGGRFNGRAFVAALRGTGEIRWQYEFADLQLQQVVTDLLIDSDGMLVGIGRPAEDSGVTPVSFAFRIDPSDGSWLWRKYTIENIRLEFQNLFEPVAGGDFLITGGQSLPTISLGSGRGAALRLNRNTGDLLGPVQGYNTILQPGFVDAAISEDGNTIYAVGTTASPEVVVTAIDVASLLPSWSARVNAPGSLGDLQGRSITVLDNKLYVLTSWRALLGNSPLILRLSADGRLEEQRLLDYGDSELTPTQIVTNGNQLIFGAELFGFNHLLQFLDPSTLNPLLGAEFAERSAIDFASQSIRLENTRVLLASSLNHMGGVLAGYDLNLQSINECSGPVGPLSPVVEERDLRITSFQETDEVISQGGIFSQITLFQPARLFPIVTPCPLDCELVEICDNQIDDDEDGLIDCEDPDVANDCCCLAQPTLDLGPDTLFCPGERTLRAPGTFASYRWSDQSTADTLLVNEPGTYWLIVTDSCQNTATDTLTLHPRARPLLDLGPDTTLCSNAVIPFLAQDGFASYEWVDGTTEKGFTAYEGGVYWVIATDSCGGVQTDTVNVRIDPVTEIELGADTTICPGDTLSFSLTGFTRYQWSQSSFIDCFDCPEVRFFPNVDTVLVVAGDLGPGCISADSIRVRVAPVTGRRDTMRICEGDTLSFGSQRVFEEGQYFDNQLISNCSFTDTLDLFLLPGAESRDTLCICPGTSVSIFGNDESMPGAFSQTFTAANGCDSTAFIQLEVLAAPETFDTLRICVGDSVQIFGNFERVAGPYARTFLTASGCDSTHQVQLEVDDLSITTRQLESDCEGAAAGAGEVLITGLADAASIRWSTGATTSSINGLTAGAYSVTVTSTAGCSLSDSLFIFATQSPELRLFPTPESCLGRADGSLGITGDVEGLLFSIDGGLSFTPSPIFEDLLPGDYILMAENEDGCDQEVPFTIGAGTNVFLLLPPNQTITLGDSVLLVPTTNAPDGGNLHWLVNTGDSCIACPTFTLRPTETVTVYATTLGECPAVDSTKIRIIERVERPFYVPNAFSPNDDGVNDVFRVFPGPGVEEILLFAVYDRWGGQVFLAENIDPASELAAWDGRLENSQDPSVGVYVYVVELRMLDGSVERKAGDVTVLR